MSQPSEPPVPVSSSTAEVRRRIEDEHRRLRGLLAELNTTADVARMEALLGDLRTLLVAHFATEEAPEGLHELVSQLAAHRLPNLQQLFAEHRDLLARIDRLRIEAANCVAGPVRRVRDECAGIAATLRRHEEQEEQLFGEAFYADLGGRS